MIIIMFLEKWQLHYQCLRPTVCRAVKTKTCSSFLLVIRQPGPPTVWEAAQSIRRGSRAIFNAWQENSRRSKA